MLHAFHFSNDGDRMGYIDPQQVWMLLSGTTKTGKPLRETRMQELRHIPRGEEKSLQNYLRFFYNALRRHHIAKTGKMKEDTLKEAVLSLKKINPNFHPDYDKKYFKMQE